MNLAEVGLLESKEDTVENRNHILVYLPDDIFLFILEYLAMNPKDLIRFGCVCQHWRDLMSMSILWCKPEMKRFKLRYNSAFFRTTVDEICQQDQPHEISQWYIHNLDDFLNQINQARISSQRDLVFNHRKRILSNIALTIASILGIIIGLAFGVNWSRSKYFYFNIGFISIYILLVIAGIWVILTQKTAFPQFRHRLRRHEQSRLTQYVTALVGIFLTVTFTHYKLFTHSSLLWVEVLIPLCFAVITLTTEYFKLIHSRIRGEPTWSDTLNCLLLPFLITLPSLLSLILYCNYVDYHHRHPSSRLNSPYSPSACLFPIATHLFFIIWYFIAQGYKAMSGFCKPSHFWDRFLSIKMRILRILVRYLTILSSGVGLMSVIFFVIICLPTNHHSVLFTQFNALFYLWLILLSFFSTEFGQQRITTGWGVDFDSYFYGLYVAR
jgi:hypothetical protein